MPLTNLNLSNVVKVDGGVGHSLAVTANGKLYAWGLNSDGQLGDGTLVNKQTPTQIGIATDWVDVACGDYHSLALKADGTVWSWGSNSLGQCATYDVIRTPRKISNLIAGNGEQFFTSVSAIANYSVIRSTNGVLWSFGVQPWMTPEVAASFAATPQRLQTNNTYFTTQSAAAGGSFIYYQSSLSTGGIYRVVATNINGQLTVSQLVTGSGGRNYIALAAGSSDFFLAISDDFKLYKISSGNLVLLDQSRRWFRVACGSAHALLTDLDGNVFSFGNNDFGQLGRTFTGTDPNIVQLESPANVGNWGVIGCGNSHSLLCVAP